MKTQLHLIILCLLLFLAGGGCVIHAAETWSYPYDEAPDGKFGGGTGSQSDPYLISTAQHLADLAYMVNDGEDYKGKYFAMTNDITLNEDVIADDGKSLKKELANYTLWQPIGKYGTFSDDKFQGTFDGRDHTIKGMVVYCNNDVVYNGLFGIVENAVVKNIHMEDCYVQCDESPYSTSFYTGSFGTLCAMTKNSTFINCTVSKSYFKIETVKFAYVGGMIGIIKGSETTRISKCKFDGNICWIAVDNENKDSNKIRIGGLVGMHLGEQVYKGLLEIYDCSSSGVIDAYGNKNTTTSVVGIGGICSFLIKGSINSCASSMDINVKTTVEIDNFRNCFISGISNTEPYGEQETAEFNNCVYSGTIQIGDADHKATIFNLMTSGIAGNGNKVNGCAFYGKFLIYSTIRNELGRIASIANQSTIGDDYKQNVVYSVGNVINVDTKLDADFQIDKVYNLLYNGKKNA